VTGEGERSQLVDLAVADTWPTDVRALLRGVASTFGKRPHPYATDLKYGRDFGESLEQELRRLLGSRPIAMYHATRLLPEEIESVKVEGLLLQTAELRARKLGRLVAAGMISASEAELWEANGPVSWPGHEARLNETCVVTPIQCLSARDAGFFGFLQDWGGESISWAATEPGRQGEDAAKDHLRLLLDRVNRRSGPAVIEVAVQPVDLPGFPYLWNVMVAGLIRARKAWNEWHVEKPLPVVVDVIQPGDPRWKNAWLRSR
jgi:hypothetical protein